MRAIIIGGGIGGLTVAIALRRAVIEATVYERAPEPREVGAGIGLWGNAIGALRTIGLAEAVIDRGEVARSAEVRDARGRVLSHIDAAAGGLGPEPTVVIHRADLLDVLLGALSAESVRFGHTLARFEQDESGVIALFGEGREGRGDVLIGADGLNSAVRAQLLGPRPARYSGYTCWRGVVTFPEGRVPPGTIAEVWGRGRRFGITRIGGGRLYWWATINAPPSPLEQGALDAGAKGILVRSHAGFAQPVPDIIAATDPARIVRNDIYDRPPIDRWSRGRVILTGDAAHPTTPNLGQGGCMAIEDGVILPRFLIGVDAHDSSAVADAFESFARHRRSRCASIVRQSRFFGRICQWESPVLCWGRDRFMRLIGPLSARAAARTLGTFHG